MTASLNSHLKYPDSTKTDHRELYKANINESHVPAKILITNTNGVILNLMLKLQHLPWPDKSPENNLTWILPNHCEQFGEKNEKQIPFFKISEIRGW